MRPKSPTVCHATLPLGSQTLPCSKPSLTRYPSLRIIHPKCDPSLVFIPVAHPFRHVTDRRRRRWVHAGPDKGAGCCGQGTHAHTLPTLYTLDTLVLSIQDVSSSRIAHHRRCARRARMRARACRLASPPTACTILPRFLELCLLYLTLSSCWDAHLTLIVKDVVLSTALKALKSSSRSPGTHWHEYFVPSTPMPQTHECRFVPRFPIGFMLFKNHGNAPA